MNDYLIFNKVLVSSILAWFIAQTMKVFILAHKEKSLDGDFILYRETSHHLIVLLFLP